MSWSGYEIHTVDVVLIYPPICNAVCIKTSDVHGVYPTCLLAQDEIVFARQSYALLKTRKLKSDY
jgi:hypothetical protein